MIATVDRDVCTGCGLCPSLCPEVFQLDDEGLAEVIATPVPSVAEDSCRQAAESCPVDAITVEQG